MPVWSYSPQKDRPSHLPDRPSASGPTGRARPSHSLGPPVSRRWRTPQPPRSGDLTCSLWRRGDSDQLQHWSWQVLAWMVSQFNKQAQTTDQPGAESKTRTGLRPRPGEEQKPWGPSLLSGAEAPRQERSRGPGWRLGRGTLRRNTVLSETLHWYTYQKATAKQWELPSREGKSWEGPQRSLGLMQG